MEKFNMVTVTEESVISGETVRVSKTKTSKGYGGIRIDIGTKQINYDSNMSKDFVNCVKKLAELLMKVADTPCELPKE